MVAAVLVGTIIGFILDNWFDTKPLLMIVFFYWICGRNTQRSSHSQNNTKRD